MDRAQLLEEVERMKEAMDNIFDTGRLYGAPDEVYFGVFEDYLTNGGDPNALDGNYDLLSLVVGDGQEETAKLLLSRGAKVTVTAMYNSITHPTALLEALVQAGGDITWKCLGATIARHVFLGVCRYNDPVHLSTLRYVLEKGSDVSDQFSAPYKAIMATCVNIKELLDLIAEFYSFEGDLGCGMTAESLAKASGDERAIAWVREYMSKVPDTKGAIMEDM